MILRSKIILHTDIIYHCTLSLCGHSLWGKNTRSDYTWLSGSGKSNLNEPGTPKYCPKIARRLPTDFLQIVHRLPTDCPQIAHRLPTDCLLIAHRLPTDCPKIANGLPTNFHRFPADCPQIARRLPVDCPRIAYGFHLDCLRGIF